jgi:farnesoic acid O-methyltransferase
MRVPAREDGREVSHRGRLLPVRADEPHRARPRPRAAVSAAVLALSLVALSAGGCRRSSDELITGEWRDGFDRAELGPLWRDTGGGYRIDGGRLAARGGHNHPVWLRKRLPDNVTIEVDAHPASTDGDIKLELYGDGASFDPDRGGYVSTGYVLIFGGWHNTLSIICRGDEHGEGRKATRSEPRVVPGRTYHFTITRRAGLLDWKIDGQPFLAWQDPRPLGGAGHEYLAFDDWESEVFFDNLVIRPVL